MNKSLCKKIICETCDALDYIHHKQIIHRDLKPENIIITNNGQILDARSDIYSLGVIISEVAGKWYSHHRWLVLLIAALAVACFVVFALARKNNNDRIFDAATEAILDAGFGD